MDNNYKNALDKIKASDSFKQELVKSMATKRKRPKAPYISAIAACLAAAVALTVFLAPMANNDRAIQKQKNDQHSFCLTANAADIPVGNENYVQIGEVSGYFKLVDISSKEAKNIVYENSLNGKETSFLPCFELRLICEGEDIDTVTFTSQDSRLWINDYTARYFVKDYSGRSEKCRNGKGESGRYYKSITCDYDNQVKASPYGGIGLALKPTAYKNSDALPSSVNRFFEWFFGYCRTLPDYTTDERFIIKKLSSISEFNDIIRDCDKVDLYTEMLNDLLNDTSVSVTVRYNDGTVQTKELRLRPSSVSEEQDNKTTPILTGKIVQESSPAGETATA